jgi:hypothetical protein
MSFEPEADFTDYLSDPSEPDDSAEGADEVLDLKLRPAEFVIP